MAAINGILPSNVIYSKKTSFIRRLSYKAEDNECELALFRKNK